MSYFESEGLVLKAGSLAFYDTMSGLVPVKVNSIKPYEGSFHLVHKSQQFPNAPSTAQWVNFTVTADHGPWKKGEIIEAFGLNVCPRKAVKHRQYSSTIRAYQVQCA